MVKILVIGSHPDDETLGVGGTIVRHRGKGDDVAVLILSDGVTARHQEIEKQKQAAKSACAIMGVADVRFAGLPDQKLDGIPLIDIIRPIQQCIMDFQPDIVYTHHGGDVNQDHRAVLNATLVAVRPVGSHRVNRVLCYEVPSATEWAPPISGWAFLPNVFINIEEQLETKIKALQAYSKTYVSEVAAFPHPRSVEAVRNLARQRGIQSGINAAEAFYLIREIG
jgi:LmbE family N-acetylglucosaminyl deacetylase